jgi:hypothetical protein
MNGTARREREREGEKGEERRGETGSASRIAVYYVLRGGRLVIFGH